MQNAGWHPECWKGAWELGLGDGVAGGVFHVWIAAASLGASLLSAGYTAVDWQGTRRSKAVVVALCCGYEEISIERDGV